LELILDSTLREGEQMPGVSFTVEEKLELARMLDEFGVEMIEAGSPVVSPKTKEAVKAIAQGDLRAEVIGHARAVKKDLDAALDCGVDRIAIFLGVSELRLREQLRMSRRRAMELIAESIEYVVGHGVKARFTAEDAVRTDFPHLLEAVRMAVEAGADRVSIADTVGIATPETFSSIIEKMRREVRVELDVHCHNDLGFAVANTLAGLRAGASCAHVTVNGIGERAGIAGLSEVLMGLCILEGQSVDYKIEMLPDLSQFVERISGVYLSPHSPVTGENAFTHKSGVHTDAVLRNPRIYEAFSPEVLKRSRRIVIDKYTGRSAVRAKLEEIGVQASEEELMGIVVEIKRFCDETKFIGEDHG
jgi:2-isopropylmalate synthase